MLEPCNMLPDVVTNVGLLLVELIIVLMLGITVVVTDVMSVCHSEPRCYVATY